MLPARFDYSAPGTLDEAIGILGALGREARPLAGGHTLIPLMRFRRVRPAHVVDLRRLPLAGVQERNRTLVIGATTTDASLERSPLIAHRYPLLADVARVVADPLVRNMGTIGGSLCHADPAGDWGAAMLAVGATLVAAGSGGRRAIPVGEFFTGSFETALRPEELLTEVWLPAHPPGAGSYFKLQRKVGDFATVGVAVQLALDEDGRVAECGMGVTAVDLTYVRPAKAEEYLLGRRLDRASLDRASGIAAEETHPRSDHRGSARYKRHMVGVLCARALSAAAARTGRPVPER